jgi:hypothetical protein
MDVNKLNKEIMIRGKLIRIASIRDEWYYDVNDPYIFIETLKKYRTKADIFTFWQRLPETKPKFNYFMEWDNVAALAVKSYDFWWTKQIGSKERNLVRKAGKKGVTIKIAKYDGDFINGMTSIFNETPVRQGKPFWHYGKSREIIGQEFSRNLHREDLIGAYFNGELIGFIFLANAGGYASITQIISKIEHRDKSPNNALMAKAVEICAERKIPYLVYAKWPTGTLRDFKRNNGFEEIKIPRYYVPITFKGWIIVKLRLHNGIKRLLPEKLKARLIGLRWKWYSRNLRK